jgi:hypothetical protein
VSSLAAVGGTRKNRRNSSNSQGRLGGETMM